MGNGLYPAIYDLDGGCGRGRGRGRGRVRVRVRVRVLGTAMPSLSQAQEQGYDHQTAAKNVLQLHGGARVCWCVACALRIGSENNNCLSKNLILLWVWALTLEWLQMPSLMYFFFFFDQIHSLQGELLYRKSGGTGIFATTRMKGGPL